MRWSETFEHDVDDVAGFGAEDEILARVTASVGDFGSVVFREVVPPRSDGDPRVADSLRLYYAFLDELTPAIAAQVISGLEAAAPAPSGRPLPGEQIAGWGLLTGSISVVVLCVSDGGRPGTPYYRRHRRRRSL